MLKHYVTFYYPGIFFSEDSTKEISERNLQDILTDLPANCFAFQFWDREVATIDDEELAGAPKNKSKMYYPNAHKYSLEEVKNLPGDYDILVSNMECNKWDCVVKTCVGNFQPFGENTEIV